LIAKVFAYTLLGFALGGLGSVLGLTPVTRGILQILVAVFMLGNGLRMLNVHPIFRYFNFETPAPVRRFLRQQSKGAASAFTPLFLGVLTVLIPCGVTQAMMAVAVGTGDPWLGAVIMLAFTLGTSPVFFGLVYLATRLGKLMEKWFVRIVAAALLILGLVSLDAGLNLVGSPFTLSRALAPVSSLIFPGQASSGLVTFDPDGSAPAQQPSGQAVDGVVELRVTNQGYQPTLLKAPAGQALQLKLLSSKTYSCARAFTIPSLDIEVLAPETGTVSVDIPAQKPGTRLGFTCSMGMYSGEIIFN
jgi:sulfite exporter TauE/SafE